MNTYDEQVEKKEFTPIQIQMLGKMLEWNNEYRYPYSYFDGIYDVKILKSEMRGLISRGYVKMYRGGFNDDGEVCGGTGFSIPYGKIDEIKEIIKASSFRSTLEKPIEGESWEIEFDKIAYDECVYGNPTFDDRGFYKCKDFIRQTILTERAKWKREMIGLIGENESDTNIMPMFRGIDQNTHLKRVGRNQLREELRKKLEEA